MKLRRESAGFYVTADGRYEVAYDFTILEGDCNCVMCQIGRDDKCPNEGNGIDQGWYVWDRWREDYAEGTGPLEFERLADARAYLSRAS